MLDGVREAKSKQESVRAVSRRLPSHRVDWKKSAARTPGALLTPIAGLIISRLHVPALEHTLSF